jgi:hypothetical protein
MHLELGECKGECNRAWIPLRRVASECPKAMTRQSYYENRISGIPDVLSTSRDNGAITRVNRALVWGILPGERFQTIATLYQCGLNVFPVSSSVFRRERIRGHPSAQAA